MLNTIKSLFTATPPAPKPKGRKPKYPWATTPVGEHFCVDNGNYMSLQRLALYQKQRKGLRFEVTEDAFGTVWCKRIK